MTASATAADRSPIESSRFRHVLGHFPTGVAVITALHPQEGPTGMAVGSFTSVSLDPPLVAFLPDKGSSSFPKIRETGSFCVNVLADDQEPVCRAFAARGADKYARCTWSPARSGSPIIDGAVAWIDCDIESVLDAGDHFIVLGRVRSLDIPGDRSPLLFFRGGYGRFSTASLSAPAEPDLLAPLYVSDRARHEMELITKELSLECMTVAAVGEELVTLGSAGGSFDGDGLDWVGQRMPFVPPLGALFLADQPPQALDVWLRRLDPDLSEAEKRRYRDMVDRVRRRGWSMALSSRPEIAFELALAEWTADRSEERQEAIQRAALALGPGSHEPTDAELAMPVLRVRNISAPVHDKDGAVVLMLTLIGLPRACHHTELRRYLDRLLSGARSISAALGYDLGADRPAEDVAPD